MAMTRPPSASPSTIPVNACALRSVWVGFGWAWGLLGTDTRRLPALSFRSRLCCVMHTAGRSIPFEGDQFRPVQKCALEAWSVVGRATFGNAGARASGVLGRDGITHRIRAHIIL